MDVRIKPKGDVRSSRLDRRGGFYQETMKKTQLRSESLPHTKRRTYSITTVKGGDICTELSTTVNEEVQNHHKQNCANKTLHYSHQTIKSVNTETGVIKLTICPTFLTLEISVSVN